MKSLRTHGSILVVTLITIALISTLVGVSFTMTSATSRYAARSLAMHQAQALAEGSLEVAYVQWKRYMDNHLDYSNSAAPKADELKFIADHPPSMHPALASRFAGFTLNTATYKVVPIGRQDPTDQNSPLIELSGGTEVPNVGTTTGSSAFTTTTNIYRYKATAEVTANPPGGPVTVSLCRFFEVSWSPLVQNAIFYEDTMDIFPGATMDVIGDVHSNSDIYAGHTTLNFWQKVTSVGKLNLAYNPGDSRSTGNGYSLPNWKGDGGKTGQYTQVDDRKEVLGASPTSIVGSDPNNVNVKGGIHEIIQMPKDSTTDPVNLASRRFFNQAKAPSPISRFSGLTILINPAAAAGSQVTVNYTPSPKNPNGGSVNIPAIQNAVIAAVTVNAGNIKDFREFSVTNTTVNLHNVDVGAISNAVGVSDPFAKTTGNGTLIYVADTSVAALPTTDATTAIRLKNGAVLSGDLSIASQNPIYVQGDYNSGLLPSSNTGAPIPSVNDALGTNGGNQSTYDNFTQGRDLLGGPYSRKAALIATDAINILSNSWLDANSTNTSTAFRKATATTMNTAFLTGNVPSAGGEYSGGVENLPRFLESWSSIPFTVYGSFIELYPSKQYTGKWSKASYDAPNRRWYFDTRFRKNPAPGTFIATTKQRAAWVRGTSAL